MRTIALSAARLTRGLGSRAASANRGKAASILWRPQTFDAITHAPMTIVESGYHCRRRGLVIDVQQSPSCPHFQPVRRATFSPLDRPPCRRPTERMYQPRVGVLTR